MSTTRHVRHMTWIPGCAFAMGSVGFYPQERPVHPANGFGLSGTSTCHLGFRCIVRGDGPAGG